MKWFIIAGAGVVGLWSISWGLIWWQPGPLTPGEFGDMFGAASALFSGIALAGVIAAILLQQGDLQLQRNVLALQTEELKLQREEMTRSSKAQEAQVKALVIAAQLNGQIAYLNHQGALVDFAIS